MGLTLGRAITDVRGCPASWKWQHLSLTAEMTHAAERWCTLARVPFLGFGLLSPPVGPSPTAQFSSGTNRPSFCKLVSKPGRLSSVAARGAPVSYRDCGWGAGARGGGSQRGARGMGLGAWRSRPGVKGPRGSSSPRAICPFSAPAPTPGLSRPAPGSPPSSEVSNGQ